MKETIIGLLDDLDENQLKIVYWTILGVADTRDK